MKSICTKTGDQGMTSIRGGIRVNKDDIRIEANGQLDQRNALLGIVRAKLDANQEDCGLISAIQRELMVIMSHVATPDGDQNPKILHAASLTEKMEQRLGSADIPACFVVPGANEISALLHLARTQARTAERRLWTLHREHNVESEILVFMNRLSDYLFLMALESEK